MGMEGMEKACIEVNSQDTPSGSANVKPFAVLHPDHESWQQVCASLGFLQCWCETRSQEGLKKQGICFWEGGLTLAAISYSFVLAL